MSSSSAGHHATFSQPRCDHKNTFSGVQTKTHVHLRRPPTCCHISLCRPRVLLLAFIASFWLRSNMRWPSLHQPWWHGSWCKSTTRQRRSGQNNSSKCQTILWKSKAFEFKTRLTFRHVFYPCSWSDLFGFGNESAATEPQRKRENRFRSILQHTSFTSSFSRGLRSNILQTKYLNMPWVFRGHTQKSFQHIIYVFGVFILGYFGKFWFCCTLYFVSKELPWNDLSSIYV